MNIRFLNIAENQLSILKLDENETFSAKFQTKFDALISAEYQMNSVDFSGISNEI